MRLRYFIGLALIGLGVWMALRPVAWQNWLGFSHQAYFDTGETYAFYSGIGPMLLTSLGLGTIISGLWHHLNCHTDGCPRLVRHKIANGEYGVCSRHWREINGHPADHKFTIENLRDHHQRHLRATGRAHGDPRGTS